MQVFDAEACAASACSIQTATVPWPTDQARFTRFIAFVNISTDCKTIAQTCRGDGTASAEDATLIKKER
jgi:hypothetical protein